MASRLISILLILTLGTGKPGPEHPQSSPLAWPAGRSRSCRKATTRTPSPIFERALELDPGNIHILYQLSLAYYFQGEYSRTVEILERDGT
jgi:tetratricopeptide (TPR) repeat protein